MTRLLCTGDLHLGAGSDYGREPGDRLKDQQATLAVIVETAVEKSVDAILFAGDAFDGPTVTPEQYAAFQDPLRDLRLEGIPFIGITGNGRHDCAMRDVKAPEVVADVAEIYTQPETRFVGENRDIAICMLPWTPVGRLIADRDGGDRDNVHQDAAELLLQVARGMADCEASRRILMLHWSIEGAALPNGLPIDEHARETILPIDALAELGFDAIVAAHIHVPQAWHPRVGWTRSIHPECPTPPIFYTGSPMPLNFGEGGYEHGVWILDVEETVAATFVPILSRPFATVDADFTEDEDFSMLLERYGDWSHIDDAIVRVRYRATEEQAAHVDHAAITDALYDVGAHKVHAIQPDIVRGNRARVDGVDEDIAPLAAVNAWADANDVADAPREALADLTNRYLQEVGA